MKKVMLILFLLISSISFGQEKPKDSLVWIKRDCDSGIKAAEKDFGNEIYNSYSYGFIIYAKAKKGEEGFEDFYKDYMRNKYSINLENMGCVINDHSSCYSEKMDQLISKKFGANIFKRGRKEAKKLFKKSKH